MIVAGTDEAGRGPLAGPVVAAAVVLLPSQRRELALLGLRDSKCLSPRRREMLFDAMGALGVIWRAQAASPARIDRDNILQASLWAMGKAVRALPVCPDLVVVDGLVRVPELAIPQRPLPRGDDLVPCVAAASVVAKVLRDRIMERLDRLFPAYGFAGHKGYPTVAHREALATHGPSPVHRRSFSWSGVA